MARPSDLPPIRHYVDNVKFSNAVFEYLEECDRCEKADKEIPRVTNYIGECFMKIAERLSHHRYFRGYSFRDEMVMCAVETCLLRIRNFDIYAETRSGKPNAFAYFTQISWNAMRQKQKKEKRQADLKREIRAGGTSDMFVAMDESGNYVAANQVVNDNVARLNKFTEREE